jgi:hypothetical protein
MNKGFQNELAILHSLNNKRFFEINNNLRKVIKRVFSLEDINEDTLITCFPTAGQNKGDIKLCTGSTCFNISIKIGVGNSVHQEKVEDFLIFLDNNFGITEDLANSIRLFIWGDETLDGSGAFKNRLSASHFSKKYPEVINKLNSYFNLHKFELIKRFVITGKSNDQVVDYLYYGDPELGFVVSGDDILSYLLDSKNQSKGKVSIGGLNFQAWNRNINGGNKSEKKRGVIQLKWSGLKNIEL